MYPLFELSSVYSMCPLTSVHSCTLCGSFLHWLHSPSLVVMQWQSLTRICFPLLAFISSGLTPFGFNIIFLCWYACVCAFAMGLASQYLVVSLSSQLAVIFAIRFFFISIAKVSAVSVGRGVRIPLPGIVMSLFSVWVLYPSIIAFITPLLLVTKGLISSTMFCSLICMLTLPWCFISLLLAALSLFLLFILLDFHSG